MLRPDKSVTQLLQAWSRGDRAALDELTPLVYAELRRMARRQLEHERPDHTLQTTELVNEVWLRLADVKGARWQDRAHFFALCAQLMRRILVDHARSRLEVKRGAGVCRIPLKEALVCSEERSADLVALDEALCRLSALDPRKGQVVELKFFGGLTLEETAEVLNISRDSVKRDWRLARLWLIRELDHAAVAAT